MKKAVLLDLDGTLLDTEESILSAFNHAFTTYKTAKPSDDDMQQHMGKPLRDIYRHLAPDHDTELLVDAHREFQRNNLHLVKAFPHVQETVAKLKSAGIKLAVVTSRLRPSCLAYLEVTNLKDFFSVIVTGDDVENHKPNPESVLKALAALDVSPADALMVGDTFADIGAGKNAGVETVGVSYGHQGQDIKNYGPDHVVHSIEEILPFAL